MNVHIGGEDEFFWSAPHVKIRFKLPFLKANKINYALHSRIMDDMTPYMPKNTGTFINQTRARTDALKGSPYMCVASPPFGRMLYYGKVMVEQNGQGAMPLRDANGELKFRYHKGAILKPSMRDLSFNKTVNPLAQSHWYDKAKKEYEDEWIEYVEDIVNGRIKV